MKKDMETIVYRIHCIHHLPSGLGKIKSLPVGQGVGCLNFFGSVPSKGEKQF